MEIRLHTCSASSFDVHIAVVNMGLVWSSNRDKFENILQEDGGKTCLSSVDDSWDDSEESFYETVERQSQSSSCDNLVLKLEIDSENFGKESPTTTCTPCNVQHEENISQPVLQVMSGNTGESSGKYSETNFKCIADEEKSDCIDYNIDRWKTEVGIDRVDPSLVEREDQITGCSTFSLPLISEEKLLQGKYSGKSPSNPAMHHEEKLIPQPAFQRMSSNICSLNTGETFRGSSETNTKCMANEEDSDCSVNGVDRWMTQHNKRTGPSWVEGEDQIIECSTFSLPLISEEKLLQGKCASKSLSEPVMSVAVDNIQQQQSKASLPCAWQVDIDCFKSKRKKKLPKKYLRDRDEDLPAGYDDIDGMSVDNQGPHRRFLASTNIATQEMMAGRKVLDLRRWYKYL